MFTPEEISAIVLSLKVAFVCSILSLPFAVVGGYWLARKEFKGKAILEGILNLPLVLPPVSTGYLLLLFLGLRSTVGGFFFEVFGLRLSFSFISVIIASIIVSFPLIIRSVKTAMEMVDVRLENAAYTLGLPSVKVFFKVTVPLALPGIVNGFILGFARCMGEFGATITFAGNIAGETQTIPLAIYSKMQVPGKETEAMRLLAFSVIISLVAMVASVYLSKRLQKK